MDLNGERPTVHALIALTGIVSRATPYMFLIIDYARWDDYRDHYILVGVDPEEEKLADLYDAYRSDIQRGRS